MAGNNDRNSDASGRKDVFLDTDAVGDLFATDLSGDLFAARPERRSPEYYDALILLGGTPEMVAPHMPELSEADVAAEMAKARGRVSQPECPSRSRPSRSERVPGGPRPIRSNWYN